MGERYRRETMGLLRIAFLSALVLELAATLGTAVVAVEIGIRLDHGGIALAPALTILVLAPELYAPCATSRRSSTPAPMASPRPTTSSTRSRPPRRSRHGARRRAARSARRAGAPGARVASLPGPRGPRARRRLARARPRGARRARGAERSGQEHDRAPAAALRPTRGGPGARGRHRSRRGRHRAAGGAPWPGCRSAASAGRDDRRRHSPRRARARHRRRRRRARRRAGAEAFIAALPDGYATRVGDAGAGLSAGQIRRIALARALLRDASLLILDEPTTNLDDESAGLVADALERLPRGRRCSLITHDEALAARVADRVVRIARRPHRCCIGGDARERAEHRRRSRGSRGRTPARLLARRRWPGSARDRRRDRAGWRPPGT